MCMCVCRHNVLYQLAQPGAAITISYYVCLCACSCLFACEHSHTRKGKDNKCIIDPQLSAIEDSLMVKSTQATQLLWWKWRLHVWERFVCLMVHKTENQQLFPPHQTASSKTPMCVHECVSWYQCSPDGCLGGVFLEHSDTCCVSSCLFLSPFLSLSPSISLSLSFPLTHTLSHTRRVLLLKCETACGQLCSSSKNFHQIAAFKSLQIHDETKGGVQW